MPQTAPALLAAALLLAAAPAFADSKPHKLDSVHITGARSVPVENLEAALQEKPGDMVTTDQIVADREAISAVLGKANVGGSIKTRITTLSNSHIQVVFQIEDQGVSAPVVNHVLPKLDHQIFVGNKKLDADTLAAASGLKPGDQLSNDKITAAQAAISAAYKRAKVNASIGGDPVQLPNGLVQITWTIKETKAPVEQKKKDDEGGLQTE